MQAVPPRGDEPGGGRPGGGRAPHDGTSSPGQVSDPGASTVAGFAAAAHAQRLSTSPEDVRHQGLDVTASGAVCAPVLPQQRLLRTRRGRVSAPPPSYGGRNRRAKDAISMLSREQDELVTTAVDAWEIAAGLEAAGLTDRIAAEVYGCADVFTLAEVLYDRVPSRFGDSLPDPEDRGSGVRTLINGVLYAVPVLFAIAAGPMVPAADRLVVLLSLVLAWGWTQGMAYIGHYRLGTADRPGAGRFLRAALLTGGGLWLTGVVAAWAYGVVGLVGAAVATAQVLYFLGSGVVVVLGGQLRILALMAPGGVAAALRLGWPERIPPLWFACAVAASVLASVALAVRMTERRRGAPVALRGVELRAGMPHAVNGSALATLLCAGLVAATDGGVGVVADIAALPIVWSMAVGEELLRRYRNHVRALMLSVHRPELFKPRARGSLMLLVATFVAATGAATAAVEMLAMSSTTLPRAHVVLACAYAVLAGGMFVAVLLAATGEVRSSMRVTLPAAVLVLVSVLAFAPYTSALVMTAGYAVACLIVLLVLTRTALGSVERVWTHR
ncbi:MAG: hypothetical protein M3Q27_01900 [Actinomycetota bacterium]|nr:hypothetical protein [Actinomycetota bacterium]